MRADIQSIFKETPPKKQVMMFSATLSKENREICRKYLRNVIIQSNYTLLLTYNIYQLINNNLSAFRNICR